MKLFGWFCILAAIIFSVYAADIQAGEIELSRPNDAEGRVVLINQPCTAKIPDSIKKMIPEGAVLYHAYGVFWENKPNEGRIEGCWMKGSPPEIQEAEANAGIPVAIVNIFTENGLIITNPFTDFTPVVEAILNDSI